MASNREKIALCVIAGENAIEEGFERMLESVSDQIDAICISYNGHISRDFVFNDSVIYRLGEICSKLEVPAQICPKAWNRNFSEARNHSFSMVGNDYDWIIWLDCDDVLPKGIGLQEVIRVAREKRAHGILMDYEYHYDVERDKVLVSHYKERIFRSDIDWKWVGPIHENCVGPVGTRMIRVPGQSVRHLRSNADSKRNRNREIVREWYENERDNPRAIMYFAHETVAMADELSGKERALVLGTAIKLYRDYLNIAPVTDDSYYCNRMIAECLRQIGRFNDSINIDLQGIKMQPSWPASYLGIAEAYFDMGDYEKAFEWASRTPEKLPDTTQGIVHLDSVYKSLIIRAQAARRLRRFPAAIACFMGAKKIYSDDFVDSLIKEVTEEAENSDIEERPGNRASLWGSRSDRSIAFFVPPGAEEWNGDLIDLRGSGGTELSILRLAQYFAQDGWRTVIFGRPGDWDDKIDDCGIEWYNASRFHPDEPFHTFVVLRVPEFLEANINAKQKILWLHDVNVGNGRYGEYGDRFKRADHIIVPSPFHFTHIQKVYGDDEDLAVRLAYIPNGIERQLSCVVFEEHLRNNKFIYASSPDRGLERLLDLWPSIAHAWEEKHYSPTLNIFYGWDSIDALIEANVERSAALANFRYRIQQRIDYLQRTGYSVHMAGRVNQNVLNFELSRAQAILYPANFLETFGIVFAQAMTQGCIPITSEMGSLPWIINNKDLTVPGSPDNELFGKEFIKRIEWLRDARPNERRSLRKILSGSTREFSWENVFDIWRRMITTHDRFSS